MNINEMKNVDIRTVDKSTLTDINDIKVSSKSTVKERVESYLKQTSNPYCIMINGFAVKFSFADTSETINDRLSEYFRIKSEII